MPFTGFPDLPTELRLQIWHCYLESPRIHILHETKDADAEPDRVLLTCTTIDAQTSLALPPCVRTDINHEARDVALRLKPPRERVRTLTTPVECNLAFEQTASYRAARGPQQLQEPVDVDWANDLIYICSRSSDYPFLTLSQRPWASKVERLAAAQP